MSQDNETLDFSLNRAQLVDYVVNSGRSLVDIAEENRVSVDDLKRWVAEAVHTQTLDLSLSERQTVDFWDDIDNDDGSNHPSNNTEHPLQDYGTVLGEGGMGRVVEATQIRLLRRVAVKQLRSEYSHTALTRRLVQEALITGMLEHPNIIPIYDILDIHTINPQIVMKKVEGRVWSDLLEAERNLEDRLERRWIEEQLTLLCRVCDAVAYAHSRGIIHRDLKPDNVMIGAFGAVYVLDWGLAVSIQDDCPPNIPRAKAERSVAGTPMYMAPEMARGDGDALSVQSDIYLLGGILHTILTGAWLRAPNTSPEGIQAIVHFEYRSPEGLPTRLQDILVKALANKPEDRYASVLEFQDEIVQYRDRLEIYEIMGLLKEGLKGLQACIDDKDADRNQLYLAFAVARFQYEQVVRQLGEPNEITPLYNAFVKALILWELDQKKVDVAATLYHEHSLQDDDLLQVIQAAEAQFSEAVQEFRKLRDLSNRNLGVRTRLFVTGIGLFLLFLVPLASFLGVQLSPLEVTSISLIEFIVMLGLGIWAKDSLFRTRINRHNFTFLLSIFVMLVVVGCIAMFVDQADLFLLRKTALISLFIFYTSVIDIRLWPTTVFLLGSLIASYQFSSLYYPLLIVSYGVVVINVLMIWWPNIQNQEDARLSQEDEG